MEDRKGISWRPEGCVGGPFGSNDTLSRTRVEGQNDSLSRTEGVELNSLCQVDIG